MNEGRFRKGRMMMWSDTMRGRCRGLGGGGAMRNLSPTKRHPVSLQGRSTIAHPTQARPVHILLMRLPTNTFTMHLVKTRKSSGTIISTCDVPNYLILPHKGADADITFKDVIQ